MAAVEKKKRRSGRRYYRRREKGRGRCQSIRPITLDKNGKAEHTAVPLCMPPAPKIFELVPKVTGNAAGDKMLSQVQLVWRIYYV